MKKYWIIITSFILVMTACSTMKVAYNQISVPEEGGMKFTQYTRDEEVVIGPSITLNEETKKLMWYAPSFISVSDNGELLAYVARANGFHNLYIKKIAGGRSTIQRTFNQNVMDMSFSKDNKKLVFTERKGNDYNIRLMNALEGAAIQQVTSSSQDEVGATFAPNNEDIFFAKQEGYKYFIWSFNTKTSLLTQYSEGFTPVMTPDGENLIMTRNNKEAMRGEIWMVNLKSGMEMMILSDPARGYSSPSISPDGKQILCVGNTPKSETRPQNLDIYKVNIDGTGLTQLTFHGGHDVSPEWAPDGKSVFFISQRGTENGSYNVWKMDINQ